MTIGEFARREAEKRRRKLGTALRAAQRDPSEEAIHVARTSWRRLEAVVRMLPWLVERREWKPFRKKLKALMRCSSEVRDRDLALQIVAGPEPLRQAIAAQRELWRGAYRERLAGAMPVRLTLRGENEETLEEAARALLAEAEAHYQEASEEVRDSRDAEALHEFRIVAKRYRYALEFFDPKGARVNEVKAVQDELGELQDRVAAIGICKAAAGDTGLIEEVLAGLREEVRVRMEGLKIGSQ